MNDNRLCTISLWQFIIHRSSSRIVSWPTVSFKHLNSINWTCSMNTWLVIKSILVELTESRGKETRQQMKPTVDSIFERISIRRDHWQFLNEWFHSEITHQSEKNVLFASSLSIIWRGFDEIRREMTLNTRIMLFDLRSHYFFLFSNNEWQLNIEYLYRSVFTFYDHRIVSNVANELD